MLVKPKSPEELAAGIEKVYKGEYVSTEIKTFSWDDTINGHIELYRRLLNNGKE